MIKITLPGMVSIFLMGCSIQPSVSPEDITQDLGSNEFATVVEIPDADNNLQLWIEIVSDAYDLERDISNAVLRNPGITPNDLKHQFSDQYDILTASLLSDPSTVPCEAWDVAIRLSILFKDEVATALLSEIVIALEENRLIQSSRISRVGNYLERIFPGFPSVKVAESIIGDFQLHGENPDVLERYIAQRVIQMRKDFPEFDFALYGPEKLTTFEFCARQTLSWKKDGRSLYPNSIDPSLNKKDRVTALMKNIRIYRELLNDGRAL